MQKYGAHVPVLTAYLLSLSRSHWPRLHRLSLRRPQNESDSRAGVCAVSGACGLTRGKLARRTALACAF